MQARRLELKSAEFRREREASWRELDRLLVRIEKGGLRSLGPEDMARLPILHRAAVSSLSVARTISLDQALLRYLESLTARSFFFVYGVKRHAWTAVFRFVSATFPLAVRRFRWHVLLAALFLVGGTVAGFLLTLADQDRYYAFVGEMAQGRTPNSTTEELRKVLYEPEMDAAEELSFFASFLFNNNAQIALLCFSLGFLAGLPVFLLLFTTGLMLGAMLALYHSRGLGLDFLFWVLPHGVSELGAIVLAGAAGLVIAQSLVFPGRHTRLQNLALRSREAGRIALGAVLMLFLAALVEGYFRQLVTSLPVRAVVAAATALAWGLYFTWPRRESAP